MNNADMPAMPFTEYDGNGAMYHQGHGLTKREHACIALRVPETGDPELDALIREAQRRDVAAMAMQAYITRINGCDVGAVAFDSVMAADALLAALEPKP